MNALVEQTQIYLSASETWPWLTRLVFALLISIFIKLVLKLISTRLRMYTSRTHSSWDNIAVDLVDGLKHWVLFVWAFFVLTKSLHATGTIAKTLLIIIVAASIYQVGIWGLHVIRNWRRTVLDKKVQKDPSSAAALGLLSTLVQITFITIIILIGLSNLGVNISALLAGLGVGGIAVALAAQNILGDLLASLSIVLDKPFVVGDFIATGENLGTVENIGIKTTRLRTLSGEQLVISNKDILESRIQNYKRMEQRRVVQRFGVVYSTPPEIVGQIPQWVKDIVLKNEGIKFDRCHFFAFGPSSLEFEFVFYVPSPEYNVYMDVQQKILLDISNKFLQEKVKFALSSQSLYIEKMPEITTRATQ